MLDTICLFLGKNGNLPLYMIALPAVCGLLLWLFKNERVVTYAIAVAASLLNLIFAFSLYFGEEFSVKFPIAPYGFELAFNTNKYAAFFAAFTALIFLLISVYTVAYLKKLKYGGLYLFYLYISIAMINGAILSDNLGMMLFFWEGLLCTLAGILLINNQLNPKTAVKALTISGLADLLLMLGIIVTGSQAGTMNISEIGALPITGVGIAGFLCLMLGALGKGGCMPFHTWIPNAAKDAPTVFMAAFPSALEKILGMYLAARIVLDIYDYVPGGTMSMIITSLGMITIVGAVAMALIQKDMKVLLSYHAVSQLGYMVLGVGTGLPIGIVGGLFHMVNHVIYKSGLFMVSGMVEKATGTTDLHLVSGLRKKMPVTTVCFIVFALSIAGFPGFNGFFSKELVFDAALETNVVFYIGAVLGAFLTALSFLKLGRSLFFGELKLPKGIKEIKRPQIGMLAPVSVLAVLCVLFGVWNALPLDHFLVPALGFTEEHFSGWPHSIVLVLISVAALLLAFLDHTYGYKKTGSALKAADHIHYAPVLKTIYASAEKGRFDMYNGIAAAVGAFAAACTKLEHGISWIYDKGVPGLVDGVGQALHRFDNGRLSRYLWLAVGGVGLILVLFLIIVSRT